MQEDKIVKRIPTNLVTKTIITSSAEYESNREYTDEDANVYEKYLQAITNVSISINGDIEKIKALEDNILEQYNKNVELEKKMEQETEKFAKQANTAIEDYNSNAEAKAEEFNTNAKEKTDEFNSNATEKETEISDIADVFDANVEEKTNTFNSNVETKTTEFNNNSNTKTEEFNNNSTEKINAFNSNAEEKIADYNEHVETLTSRIADLEEETEDLFNALDTEKASGTELYIEDAKPCKIINTEINGMYKQETTNGYQLLDLKDHTVNSNNIISTITKNKIKCTGSSTSVWANITTPSMTKFKLEANKTYTIVINKELSYNFCVKINKAIDIKILSGNVSTTFISESEITSLYFYIQKANLQDLSDVNITDLQIIIYEGEYDSAKAFEPYTGGIPSPSPDYPQEIEQVESVKLMCNNANLFNITDYTNLNLIKNGSAVITKAENNFNFVTSANNYCGAYFTKEKLKTYIDGCKEDETYTFSFDVIASKATNFRFGTDNMQFKTITTTKQRISVKGTLANTLTFYSMSQEAGTTITISNIKVTKTEDIEYTPYQNQTINVDLKGNKLCAISDTIKDKLLIDRNGNVALQKNVGYVKYTNKEGWQTNGATEFRYGYITPILKVPAKANEKSFLSNLAIQSNPSNSQTNMVLSGVTSSFKLRVYISKHFLNTELDQMNAFNELLQKTPMELYYQLATPELINLGQLTELPKTFNGINNIWAETNLGNTEIEIEYVQDVKKLLEKQAEQQNARLDNIETLLSTTQTSALLLDNMQSDLEKEVE